MKPLNTIFIVDDDPIHQQITEIMLNRLNVACHVAKYSDAQEVLDHFKANLHNESALPDIILLDLNMPIMDGWEFLEAFTHIRPLLNKLVKIYVLTSSIDEKDKERVDVYDYVNGYLTKPLTNEIILQIGQ
ncbi:CheY-like chemotaxis protein [Chitinophaga skermanii]|uniref:CheY-like chemotaxis protein n=1 Tax=Chitinophaga skermanii TaxID=331697 RepID=A0A327QYX4_9BACT|nr:response regulator [Chitinophaga skermanii]RAJ06867.1 CheY-like chemotaxis protein [Chitinophaga skermanii]